MKKFAFVLTFRNRNWESSQRCLYSMLAQSYQNFQIVLVDYGSNTDLATKMADFCAKNHIIYEYADSRYWFWNKAHALNIAYQLAQAEFVVMADIDMIYPKNFLEKILLFIDKQKILHYRCYYLPQNFEDYEKIPHISTQNLELSGTEATGLFVAPQQKILEIGGSDEFFMIWGMEDTDLSLRLRQAGLQIQWLPTEQSVVFHQWHEHSQTHDFKPQNWIKTLEKYAYSQKQNYRPKLLPYPIQRTALEIFLEKKFENIPIINLENPIECSWQVFLNDFEQGQGKYLIRFENQKPSTTTAKIVQKINQIFEKLPTAYRLHAPQNYLTAARVKDLLLYWVLYNRQKIADYYFSYQQDKVEMLVFRK